MNAFRIVLLTALAVPAVWETRARTDPQTEARFQAKFGRHSPQYEAQVKAARTSDSAENGCCCKQPCC
jgi:hypothetical protein